MKPLKDNWFLNTYLGVSGYERPRTVCELGRKIVTRTFMWFLVAVGLSVLVVPPVATLYNLSVMWYTGAPFDTVYNEKVATLSGIMYIVSSIYVTIAAVTAVVFGIRWCRATASHAIDKAMYKFRKKRGYYTADYTPPETPILDFISDLYKRFKDKTCVMLEYQDEIDERRRREERYKRWVEAEGVVARALRESDTSKPSNTTEKDDFDELH